jgi:uncharacterized protein (TIGR03435 family)
MQMLAAVLSQLVGRPVADRTGLTAGYTYKLEYAQERGMAIAEAPPENGAPSVFTALQEQLGLKLEPARVPVETIVIERAQRPSEN